MSEKSSQWRKLFLQKKEPSTNIRFPSSVKASDNFLVDPLVRAYVARGLSRVDAAKKAAATRKKAGSRRGKRKPPPSRVGLRDDE